MDSKEIQETKFIYMIVIKKLKNQIIKIYKGFQNIFNKIFKNASDLMFLIGAFYLSITIVIFVKFCFDPVYFNINEPINPELADQFGGFIGGLFVPLLTISSTFFLIATLLTQIKTNRRNTVEIAIYKLIEYHKENAQRMRIKIGNQVTIEGNEVFEFLTKKYEAIYFRVEKTNNLKSKSELTDVTYKLFFHGYSKDQDEILEKQIGKHLNISYGEFIKSLRHNPETVTFQGNAYSTVISLEYQLGHYFRNLYNTVSTVHNDATLSHSDKKFYLKLLRTQMSTPEIWLLFLNSQSEYGNDWISNKFIEEYELIKNIPYKYSKIIDPKSIFKSIKFEYEKSQL